MLRSSPSIRSRPASRRSRRRADLAKIRDDAVAALTRLAAAEPRTPPSTRPAAPTSPPSRWRARAGGRNKDGAPCPLGRRARAGLHSRPPSRRGRRVATSRTGDPDPEGGGEKTEAPRPPPPPSPPRRRRRRQRTLPGRSRRALRTGVEARARALGFAVARTEPLPEAAPFVDFVAARIGTSTACKTPRASTKAR